MVERPPDAPDRGEAHGSGRALVVANERVAGRELRDALVDHLGSEIGEVFVVAPALADSGLKYALGDIDDAIEPARERLERTLAELRDVGMPAAGEVGDSDPMQAISDEIQKFDPDQILVVGHRDEDGAFAESGLLEQAQRDLDLPVTELVVDDAAAPHVLDVRETDPVAGRKRGRRPSYNWPPLSRRDMAGIFVAIAGTLLLGALAAEGVSDADAADLGWASIARVLIALGMALVNLAHVVGLFLFQSVGYQGMWNRFFARLSLVGTLTAVVVSLLLGLAM